MPATVYVGTASDRQEDEPVVLWTVHGDGRRLDEDDAVGPDERLSWPLTIGFGLQHVAAMFGATVLVPTMTHMSPTTTLFFSGIGTLLFLVVTRNRVPSYLGSSFAFIAPLTAARDSGVAAQLGAVLLAGLLLLVVGIATKALGVRLLDSVMPPVVTGAVVMLVGLNLAPTAKKSIEAQPLIAALTLGVILVAAILVRGIVARVSVLAGIAVGWLAAAVTGRLDDTKLTALRDAAWFGAPEFHTPVLRPDVLILVLPVLIVLVAENVGHVKAIGTITGRDLDGSVGDALIGNGLSTTLAGMGGGSGTTTYAENIGVMAATRVYSTAACAVAAVTVVLLSFSPKFGALINTVPAGVTGGATLVLYGLIALIGVRIWLDNRVNLSDPLTLLVAGAAIVAGAGDVTVKIASFQLGGIAWGSALIVIGYPALRLLRARRARG